jgi:hypothetical protein
MPSLVIARQRLPTMQLKTGLTAKSILLFESRGTHDTVIFYFYFILLLFFIILWIYYYLIIQLLFFISPSQSFFASSLRNILPVYFLISMYVLKKLGFLFDKGRWSWSACVALQFYWEDILTGTAIRALCAIRHCSIVSNVSTTHTNSCSWLCFQSFKQTELATWRS